MIDGGRPHAVWWFVIGRETCVNDPHNGAPFAVSALAERGVVSISYVNNANLVRTESGTKRAEYAGPTVRYDEL
jgi:hypothetical protein